MTEADFLIVGSGPAGVSAAWPLVKSGKRVTMIDAGNSILPSSPSAMSMNLWRQKPDRWKDILGDDLGGLYTDTSYSPKFATPLGRAVIGGGLAASPKIKAKNMIVARAAAKGGLSAICGAFSTAFDDVDMQGFPIASADLAEGYKATAARIGLTGKADDLESFHGAGLPLSEPPPLIGPSKKLFEKYEAGTREKTFALGHARNAVLMADKDGRKGCVQSGLCLYGCAQKSIYNSGDELEALSAFPNFTYVPGARVEKITALETGVQKLDVRTSQGVTGFTSRKLLLAAGTLNTTALLLDYFKLYGQKLKLLCNPVAGMAFVIPSFIGKAFPEKSFALGRLSYRLGLEGDDYATGVVYDADTLPLNLFAQRMPLSRPASLVLSAALAPAMLMATCYLSSDASASTVELKEAGGRKTLLVEGNTLPATQQKILAAGRGLAKRFAKLGAYLVPGSLTVSPPGSDGHLAGTVPMNGNGPLSCTADCELASAPGVYVIDGTWFPRLPAKHCTFTIMANALRVGEALARK